MAEDFRFPTAKAEHEREVAESGETEAWKIAQLAATLSSGTVSAGVKATDADAAVDLAHAILEAARRRAKA